MAFPSTDFIDVIRFKRHEAERLLLTSQGGPAQAHASLKSETPSRLRSGGEVTVEGGSERQQCWL